MTEPHKIWIEQCEAGEGIEQDFGTQKALEYLVGEKFLNYSKLPKPVPTSGPRSRRSSPRSRRSSSAGN